VRPDLAITSRRAGRLLSALAAVLALGLAVRTAVVESMPELHIYDGWWMVCGAAVAAAIVVPLVWRWPRDRALLALVIAVIVGEWLPLWLLALRAGMPVMRRIQGAVIFSSADIIGVALPVGAGLAWLALREYRPGTTSGQAPEG
jgi:hypothetical protein